MAILERDVEVYTSAQTSTWSDARKIKINSGGYNFSQGINVSRYGRNRLAETSSRDASAYVASINNVTANLTHYLNPRLDGSDGDCAEKTLWLQMIGGASGYTQDTTPKTVIDFTNSNIARLPEGTLWFAFPNGDRVYRINETTLNGVSIDFGIDKFPTITWNIAGNSYEDLGGYLGNTPSATDTTTEHECLLGKLTTIDLSFDTANTFNLALVRGNININNNIKYTGRKRIGQVEQVEDHFTGDRVIEGTLVFYLHTGTGKGADFLDYLETNKTDLENNLADITINLGGDTAPYVQLYMPNVMFNMPQLGFNQTAMLTAPFIAFESSTGAGDEITITYFV